MRGRRLRLPFSSNLALMVLMLAVCEVLSCGPGTSGSSRRNRNTKMKFKQVIPDVEETSLAASGKYTGKVIKGSKAYKALVSNFNTNMVFRDDEKTGDDRRMTPVSDACLSPPVAEHTLGRPGIIYLFQTNTILKMSA